jgi:chemotaxis protein methyltransferase CheR
VSDPEFRALTGLIYDQAGIRLSAAKKALLTGRLSRRVRELGLRSFGAYRDHLLAHPDEWTPLLDRITTNETHFFREPRQFELMANEILPRLKAEAEAGRRPRRVRAWSAGCSSGEEPFSLAMLLRDRLGAGFDVDIVATDLSTRVLQQAREATWPMARAAEIPERYLKRYMLRGVRSEAGKLRAGDELRAHVRFERQNLMDDRYAVDGPFDLVLCRNVLIYFDPASKAHVLARLIDRLSPGGHLFLGHAETLAPGAVPMRSVCPNVYVREAAAS